MMKNIRKFFIFYVVLLAMFLSAVACAASRQIDEIFQKRNRIIADILSEQLPKRHFSGKVFNDALSRDALFLYIRQLDFQKRFLLVEDVKRLEAKVASIDDNFIGGKITFPAIGYDLFSARVDLVQKMVETMLNNDQVRSNGSSGAHYTPSFSLYTVEAGDSLLKIAARYEHLDLYDILRDNDLDNPNLIHVGDQIKLRNQVSSSDDLFIGNFNVRAHEFYETDSEKIDFSNNIKELKDRWRKILKAQIIQQYLGLVEDQKKDLKDTKLKEKLKKQKNDAELWQEAIGKVGKRNKNFFLRLRRETLQDHYDRFFNCITRAFGPHTNYIPPASKEQFDIDMRGSLEGIGALLREDDGYIKIVNIIPGSASARQGSLGTGDIIMEVAQEGEEPVDISNMRLRDAIRLIRGPKGEAVTLTVKKVDSTSRTIRIVRDVVQIEETFVKSTVVKSPGGKKMGYIFIPSFYRDFNATKNGLKGRNSTDDTRRELLKLKKENVDGIVLDLRDNRGGALMDAVDIAGFFIKSGPIVQCENSAGGKWVRSDVHDQVYFDGPMVVLVNKFSASASEIVAAALQDYRRAVVVGGKHTHGKGTVQEIIDLNDKYSLLHFRRYENLGALKVMIQKFYRVSGGSTQYRGVEPDIVLPDLFGHLKSGERYLDFSLPWDSIESVEYTPWSDTPFNMDKLRARSLERVSQSEDFKVIREEVKISTQRSEETNISLQLDEMRSKREEATTVREKVGAHYPKYKKGQDGDINGSQSDGERIDTKEKWLENVNTDPYIREAVNIVADIFHFTELARTFNL